MRLASWTDRCVDEMVTYSNEGENEEDDRDKVNSQRKKTENDLILRRTPATTGDIAGIVDFHHLDVPLREATAHGGDMV